MSCSVTLTLGMNFIFCPTAVCDTGCQ